MAPSPIDIQLHGAEHVARVVREVRRLNDPATKKLLYAGLNRATRRLKDAALINAAHKLPHRGGMDRTVAKKTKMQTSTVRGGVAIKSKRGRSWEDGRLRHPVYGNRKVWVSQPIPGGWFSEPMEAGAPGVRRELIDVMDAVVRDIAARTDTH